MFIDRVAELEWVREYAGRSHAAPFVIYGPEGCGKARSSYPADAQATPIGRPQPSLRPLGQHAAQCQLYI